ncbi:MAG: hypothetical protein EBU46_18220, partial [Nitrosomonadaceae bacterium]|nr:hypothetical protein [Nitrosomonadaceae bacterium]
EPRPGDIDHREGVERDDRRRPLLDAGDYGVVRELAGEVAREHLDVVVEAFGVLDKGHWLHIYTICFFSNFASIAIHRDLNSKN